MRSLQFGVLLAMAFTAFSLPCVAATLEVQKDGSGDFLTIQVALDAAQEGDTVLIGPGRYDTFSEHTFETGGTLAVVGVVTTPNVTIEGTSRSGVVVGPVDLQAQLAGVSTLGLGTDATATGTTIRNLTVEHCQGLIGFVSSGTVESVTGQRAGQTGIQVSSLDGLVIRDCLLENNASQGIWLVAQAPAQNVLIENCTIEGSFWGIDVGSAENVTIQDCEFIGNRTATQYWNGATGRVLRCTYSESSVGHIAVVKPGEVQISDCFLGPGARWTLDVQGIATGSGNWLGGGTESTVYISGGYASFSQCTIQNGGADSVWSSTSEGQGFDFIDLRNNYWGTTDAGQIAAWITSYKVPVAYEPFLQQSVGVESLSIGELKARFGGDK